MTDKFLAELRQLLGNAAEAGALDPRLVIYVSAGEVIAYLQADAQSPGETWASERALLPSAAAWPEAVAKLSAGGFKELLDEERAP